MAERIEVRRHVAEADRKAMAAIYWEAFGGKLRPVLGARERALRVLEKDIRPENAFGAYRGGELLGIAGVTLAHERVLDVRPETCVAEYGWLRGRILARMMGYAYNQPHTGEVYLDALAVTPDARGQGVGSALLEEVLAYAREMGKRTIGLEVIDTNPGARRLYERMGYRVAKRQWMPYAYFCGFTGMAVMVRQVD